MMIKEIQDIKSFELFFKTNYKPLCAFANKFVNDVTVAEDIVSNIFVKLWENRQQLNIETNLKSYLLASIKNQALNYIKHQKTKLQYSQYHLQINQLEVEEIQTFELEEKLIQSIDNLPTQQRQIFIMSRYQGLKNKEIAEQLKISIKNVEYHISKALLILRENLKDFLTIFLCLL